MPSDVATVDGAVVLFGQMFPVLGSNKHRVQLLEHFAAAIKSAKAGLRRQAVQVNIFAAVLCALKQCALSRKQLNKDKVCACAGETHPVCHRAKVHPRAEGLGGGLQVVQAVLALIYPALTHEDKTLRCAAGEALGRMAQTGTPAFVDEQLKAVLERLQQVES